MRRMAGFTLLELMIVIAVIAVIAAIAIPNLMQARMVSNETAAIGSLRAINSAQAIFRDRDKDKNGICDYTTSLSSLSGSGLIDGSLGSGTKQGYSFRLTSPDIEYRYVARAAPLFYGKSGVRYFRIDEQGVIRFSTTGLPTANGTPLGE